MSLLEEPETADGSYAQAVGCIIAALGIALVGLVGIGLAIVRALS